MKLYYLDLSYIFIYAITIAMVGHIYIYNIDINTENNYNKVIQYTY